MVSEKTPQGVVITPTMVADLNTVERHSNSERMWYLREKILKGQAKPKQILDWYRGMDPLSENDITQVLTNSTAVDKVLDNYLEMAKVYELASSCLLKHAEIPMLQGVINKEVASHYLAAAEMMGEASDILNLVYNVSLEDKYRANFGVLPESEKLPEKVKQLDTGYVNILLDLSNVLISDKSITDPYLRFLGLEAYCKYLDHIGINTDSNVHKGKFAANKIEMMIAAFSDVFFTDERFLEAIFRKKLMPKGDIKGYMHELMWFLDAHMYLLLTKNFDTRIYLTTLNEDWPLIGKPTLNRASDILIEDYANDIGYHVQLKSSTDQKDKQYHPIIRVVYEQNFRDFDAGRLFNKFKAYRNYIESGFDPSFANNVRRYILPSVIEEFESDSGHKDSFSQLAQAHGAPLRPSYISKRRTLNSQRKLNLS